MRQSHDKTAYKELLSTISALLISTLHIDELLAGRYL